MIKISNLRGLFVGHGFTHKISLLPADVKLKINLLDLEQVVSYHKLITIASYDANCMIRGCYVCGSNWGICDYYYAWCVHAALCMCT